MKRMHRLFAIALIAAFFAAVAAPAVATESTSEAETTTTAVAEPIMEGDGPAVPAPPPEEEAIEQPWTARYIYPTIVVVTILLIVGLVVGYSRGIRSRYTVVG